MGQAENGPTSAAIDRALSAAWQSTDIAPTEIADDAEFLRRVYLDLTGKISFGRPGASVFEWRARVISASDWLTTFLPVQSTPRIFSNTWRDVLLAGTNPELRVAVPELESWLRLRFAANTPYNQLVAELVSTSYAGTLRTGGRA